MLAGLIQRAQPELCLDYALDLNLRVIGFTALSLELGVMACLGD